jgi:hypothetical protein
MQKFKNYFLYPLHNSNININNTKKSNNIITTLNNNITNEINAFNLIKLINNYENYFYIFNEYQELSYNEIKEDDLYLVYTKLINNTNYIILNYTDKSLFSLHEYIINLINYNEIIKVIINSYLYLLDSIHILIQNKLIHNNISHETIYLHTFNDIKPVLIKFDYSIDLNLITDLNTFFIPYIENITIYSPFELHIISFLYKNHLNSLSIHNIESIIITFFNNYNNISNKINSNSIIINEFKQDAFIYLNTYLNKDINYIFKDIITTRYYESWDIYSLNLFYINVINNLTDEKIWNIFHNILLVNINPNPNKRLTILNTINNFHQCIEENL